MNTTATPTASATISFVALPSLNAELDGGIFRGCITKKDGTHCAVIQLPNKAQDLNWKQAKAWAEEQGGQLASKAVAALVTSNAEIERGWYWTEEEVEGDASCAWDFGSIGGPGLSRKSAAGGALAFRLIPITA